MKLKPGCRHKVFRRRLVTGNWTNEPARCGRPVVDGEDYCKHHVDTEDAALWRQLKEVAR